MGSLPIRFIPLMIAGSVLSFGLLGALPPHPLAGQPLSPLGPVVNAPPPPSIPLPAPSKPIVVQPSDYGVDVFSYDTQLLAPSTVPALETLGMGMQQFPNENQWSWVSNTFRGGGTAPVSLARWGQLLTATHTTGLFIFDYDENPTFTGGGTPADATQLTQYIVQHHLPITAIVIGSEEYGTWDHSTNLNPSFSAQYYATQALRIAQAIHAVDPAMRVGVSFDLSNGPNGLLWNQTVLRTDASAIQFVSVHDYPNEAGALSNSGLLTTLPQEIAQAMAYVKTEIAANVPAPEASQIQTWITEYNPYGQPGSQSTAPIYGAAMVESAMLWRLDGAQKLFVWSYDGQAHVATPGWPVATNSDAPFGTFALTGDGQSPELAENAFYPSGQALSAYWQAMAGGPTTLQMTQTAQGYVGTVGRGASARNFLINTDTTPMTVGPTIVPAASMAVESGPLTIPGTPVIASPVTATYQSTPPEFAAPASLYPGESVTLSGQNLSAGSSPSRVVISENGVNYGAIPDAYAVDVTQSTPTSVTFIVPNGTSGPVLPSGTATIQVQTADQTISPPQTVLVTAPPPVTLAAPISAVTPGEWLTLTGSGFGSTQGTGYVEISQNGIHYGAPPDAYHLAIAQWNANQIRVQVPGGQSGPALTPGPATIQVVNAQGTVSNTISVTVRSL